jgi:two-component system, LuxR family, response regulator FixJ
MSRQVVKLPRLQFADVTYRALNGSFARWTGYKLFVAATQQIADWNKKLGMFEYVDHFADQVPSPREGAKRSNLARDDWIRALRIPVDGAVQIREVGVTKDTATVIVVDDETSVRHALTEMLSVFGYNVEAYPSAEDLLQSLDPREIGCIVADVRMPGMDGIELVQELSRRDSANPVIVFSGHADIAMAVAAIRAGAEDFIEKPIDDSKLVAAINRGLARRFERQQRQETMQDLWARFDRLTPREVQVFDLVVEGHTSASIANLLKISPRTVESYRVPIMEKMGAASIAGLVRSAVRLGRLEP